MTTPSKRIPRVLTIAGSDSGGGAGIQADLKTFAALGVHGMTAITAVTAQNTLGVQASHPLPLDILEAQVRSVATDIGVDAVKTGMLPSIGVIELVATLVRELRLPNLVVDPVMIAKGGSILMPEAAHAVLLKRLFPLATVVTPNLDEATALLGHEVRTLAAMRDAAKALHALGPQWVVVKGGHLGDDARAIDIAYDGQNLMELDGPRLPTKNTHGTGCVFSAAIAAMLALGAGPEEAIWGAKAFVTRAIAAALPLGSGHGPVNPRP